MQTRRRGPAQLLVHLGRLIEPEEIADTIRYAIKNDAVNATCLEVAGGMISGMIAK